MTASRSDKAGRDEYFEGGNEPFGFRLMEVDPNCVDVLFQPMIVEWEDIAG